ncbi:MAG: GNAT family N-acetyltransferase [Woeseiaceae bacterium]
MRATIADSIGDFDPRAWNALAGGDYPFLTHEFLLAAEQTGSAAAESGWTPRHIGLYDPHDKLVAAMPLYEKSHSWGEFVFDWNWAHAYEKAGLDYYPKLVAATPFTPASSRKLLASTERQAEQLLDAAKMFMSDNDYSSLHVLFPEKPELRSLENAGFKIRKDCQFHWHNQNYENFDDFLATFSSAKRKKAKRDRRHVTEQGIRFRRVSGSEADAAIWKDVYELISITFLRRGSLPYFSLDFFMEVSRQLPENILLVVAEKNRQPIAAAVFFDTANTLYGRYWGADAHYNALHFETCYYQGIDYCIANKRQRFEPGTQGEHKVSRGFIPVNTWSAHWLERPEFFDAIGRYLQEETRHIDHYVDTVSDHSPYKNETAP